MMKKIILSLILISLTLVPNLSWAVHDLVFISALVKFDDSTCAVELEISGDNQDAFTDEDNIKLNDQLLVDFQALVAAGINDPGGNHDAGAKILATSSSFDANILRGDLFFGDANCVLFDQNAMIQYFIDGDNLIDTLDAALANGFGSDNTAAQKTSAGAAPQFINLEGTTLVIENNRMQTVVIGTNSPGGGCSLTDSSGRVTKLNYLMGSLMIGLLLGAWFRVRLN